MILEVYDADMLTKGDFLGQVILSSTQLLFPPSEKLTCALEPKPGMSEKQLKLIKGNELSPNSREVIDALLN